MYSTYSNTKSRLGVNFWTEVGSEQLALLHYSIRLEMHKHRRFCLYQTPRRLLTRALCVKVHCRVHNSPQKDLYREDESGTHPQLIIFNIHFNIILPPTPSSST
jgi:hypothetical protein